MPELSAIVALLTLGTVTTQMSKSTTRVALLASCATSTRAAITAGLKAPTATSKSASRGSTTGLGTVAGYVAGLAALVAFLVGASTRSCSWALSGHMADLTTTETGYRAAGSSTTTGWSGILCAFALDVSLLATAVACWIALFGAVL